MGLNEGMALDRLPGDQKARLLVGEAGEIVGGIETPSIIRLRAGDTILRIAGTSGTGYFNVSRQAAGPWWMNRHTYVRIVAEQRRRLLSSRVIRAGPAVSRSQRFILICARVLEDINVFAGPSSLRIGLLSGAESDRLSSGPPGATVDVIYIPNLDPYEAGWILESPGGQLAQTGMRRRALEMMSTQQIDPLALPLMNVG